MRAGQAFSVAAEFRSAAGGSRCEYVCMVFLVGRYVYFRRTHFFARLWCLCGRGSRLTIVNPFPQIRTWIRTRSEPTVPGCARCELLWSDWGRRDCVSVSVCVSVCASVSLCLCASVCIQQFHNGAWWLWQITEFSLLLSSC